MSINNNFLEKDILLNLKNDEDMVDLLIKSLEFNVKFLKLIKKKSKNKNHNFNRSTSSDSDMEDYLFDEMYSNMYGQNTNLQSDLVNQEDEIADNNLFRENNLYNESLEDCELLWNRRRNLHNFEEDNDTIQEIYKLSEEYNSLNDENSNDENIEECKKETQEYDIEGNIIPKINPLMRLKPDEREMLLYKFYKKSKYNVSQIMKIDEDNPLFEEKLQEESDRMINEWIQFQYKK